jgi:hypothetical protein
MSDERNVDRMQRILDRRDVKEDIEAILEALEEPFPTRDALLATMRLVLALWLEWSAAIAEDTDAPGGSPEAS